MRNAKGFTLIELMVVISIIGILAAIAIPNFSHYRNKSFVCEGYSLASPVRYDIRDYVDATGILPKDNAAAGLAPKDQIRGKYVKSMDIEDGSILILFNGSNEFLKDYFVKFRVEIDKNNPTGPLIWNVEKKNDKKS